MSSSSLQWGRLTSEFVVIVVGVLVALALDQAVSDRADRVSETEYLRALSLELREDSALFANGLVPILARADSALEAIGPVVRGSEPFPTDTLDFLRQVVTSSGQFTQLGVRSTIDELLATGSLRLIESSELRSAVVSYYEGKRVLENTSAIRISGYRDVVHAYLPGDAFLGEVSDSSIRAVGVRRAVEALRTDEFARTMTRHGNYLVVIGPRLQRVQDAVEVLLPQVLTELERLR